MLWADSAIPASLSRPLLPSPQPLHPRRRRQSRARFLLFIGAFKTLVPAPASVCCESFVGFPPSFLVDVSSRPTRRHVVTIASHNPRLARLCPRQSKCLVHVRCPGGPAGRRRERSVSLARASAPAACLHSHPPNCCQNKVLARNSGVLSPQLSNYSFSFPPPLQPPKQPTNPPKMTDQPPQPQFPKRSTSAPSSATKTPNSASNARSSGRTRWPSRTRTSSTRSSRPTET